MKAVAYLNFDGNCREAFDFYARALGARVAFAQTFADSPMKDQTPPEYHNRALHVRLEGSDYAILGSDSPPGMPFSKPHGFAVCLLIDQPADVDRIFNALVEGGTVTMPVDTTFWSARFGMCVDRFGIPWILNCEKPA
jgi:PhnB protein